MDCLFCKIINREIPAEILFEDENFICIRDINPKAALHLLVLTKKHIESLDTLPEQSPEAANLFGAVKKVANSQGLRGWKTIINTGIEAGQTIFHLHAHVLGGKILEIP